MFAALYFLFGFHICCSSFEEVPFASIASLFSKSLLLSFILLLQFVNYESVAGLFVFGLGQVGNGGLRPNAILAALHACKLAFAPGMEFPLIGQTILIT